MVCVARAVADAWAARTRAARIPAAARIAGGIAVAVAGPAARSALWRSM
jgi:hypothetical protein